MSLEEGSVECGRGATVCVCLLPQYCRHGRAAWQNHYGLCKHILTSWLEPALPHTNTAAQIYLSICIYAHTHVHTHTGLARRLSEVMSVSCRCSLFATVTEPHVVIILIAYFPMFVYKMATCRCELNRIYRLWLLVLFSLTHKGKACLVWAFTFPLISSRCHIV